MAAFLLNVLKHPLFIIPAGLGATFTGFDFLRTSQSGNRYVMGDQENKTYIVTGATSGIGKQLTKELAMKDATVIMACRNKNKCLSARREIVLKTRNKKVYCRICDLSDMSSVHNFAQKLMKASNLDFKRIDGIILNAATKCKKYKLNGEGIEETLATNHMGSFLLVGLLLQKLLEQDVSSKIVFVTTDIATKNNLKLDLEKLNEAKFARKWLSNSERLDTEKGKYDMHSIYKYSKLIQLIFAKELAERLKDTKISVIVADPGGTKTDLNRDEVSQNYFILRWPTNFIGYITGNRKPPERAIYTISYAIADDDVGNGSFVNKRRKIQEWGENADNNNLRQVVWRLSEQWTKLDEHMKKIEEEIERPKYYENDPEKQVQQVNEMPRRSAKYLWMA